MKLKTILFTTALAAMTTLVGCGEDDLFNGTGTSSTSSVAKTPKESDLIGTWADTITVGEQSSITMYTFNADGSCVVVTGTSDNLYETSGYSWDLDSNKLSITIENSNFPSTPVEYYVSLKGKVLTCYADAEETVQSATFVKQTSGDGDGDGDGDGTTVIEKPHTPSASELIGSWSDTTSSSSAEVVSTFIFEDNNTMSMENSMNGSVLGTTFAGWVLNEDELVILYEVGASLEELKYWVSLEGDTLSLYTSPEMKAGTALTYVKKTSTGTGTGGVADKEPVVDGRFVTLDRFTINAYDSVYTNQNTLGHAIGYALEGERGTEIGGGNWFAYASATEYDVGSENATIYTFDEMGDPDTIVAYRESEVVEQTAMRKALKNDKMMVVLDCRDATMGRGYYYAAISTPIAGDYSMASFIPGSEEINEMHTWNLSELKAIHIKGALTGAISIGLEGFESYSSNEPKTALWNFSSSDPSNETGMESFDKVFYVSDMNPADWMGADWRDIQYYVSTFKIELNTSASEGGDYAALELEEIILEFESSSAAIDAFPVLSSR